MLALGCVVHAQSQLFISINSQKDKEAIEYADILVSVDKSFHGESVVGYAVASELGRAKLEVPNGNYFVKVSAIGHLDYISPIQVNQHKTLNITLQPSDEMLGQAVVTIQPKPQSSTKSVEKVLVLTKKELDNRSVFNLRDALAQQMNVQISNDNSTGSSVSLMGVSGQNVKILIDGVPVIGRLDGNIDLSQINLNDIERIEIVEGPVSTAYGSNALAGVINIITKKKTSTAGEINVDGYHETNGQDNVSVTAGRQIKKYNIRAGVSRNFFAGWNPEDQGRFDLWKPKEQYNGRFQISRSGERTEVLIKTEVFSELLLNKGKPLPSYYETAFDEEFRTRRFDQKIQVNKQLDTNKRFSGYLAYNVYTRLRNKFFKDLVTLNTRKVVNDGGNDTTGFNAAMARGTYSAFSLKRPISYQIGYDLLHQTGNGARIEGGDKAITDLAIFATSEIKIREKLSIKPGLRVAYNSSYDAPLAPTLSTRYKHKDYVYRLSYGRGFRAPDIKELYLYFVDVNHNVVGNQDLRAERSHNFQFSATGFHKLKTTFVRPSVSVFYNDISDKITLAGITATEYTYVNLDRFKSAGGNVKLGIASPKTRLNLGWSFTRVESVSNAGEGSKAQFSYNELLTNLSRKFGKTTLNVYVKYNGPKSVFNLSSETDEIQESRIDGYTLMDVQLARHFFEKRFQLNIGSKNVLGVENVANRVQSSGGVHTSAPANLAIGTGRSYFIKGILKLTK